MPGKMVWGHDASSRLLLDHGFFMLRNMNPNVREIIQNTLRLDSEGRLVASGINEKASLRHLVLYFSQKNSSDREKLLTLLRKMALHEHHLLGQRID